MEPSHQHQQQQQQQNGEIDHRNIATAYQQHYANTSAAAVQYHRARDYVGNHNSASATRQQMNQTAQSTHLAQQMLLGFLPPSLMNGIPSPVGLPQAASNVWATFWQQQQQQQQQPPPSVGLSVTAAATAMHYMQQQQQQYSSALQHESPLLSTQEQPPTYVNAKQYKRIMQRRTERNVMDEYYERQQQRNKKRATRYQHESRHKHACTRPRGDHGRYLNKQELEQYYKDHPELRPPSSSSSPKSSQEP